MTLETSTMRFFESLKSQMEMMIRTGDCPRNHRGKPRDEHRSDVEEETRVAIELLREGKSATQAGQFIGISGNALHRRLNSRGLTITKIREELDGSQTN